MTVKDIIKITNGKVYVMDSQTVFKIIYKSIEELESVCVGFTREEVYNKIVLEITASDDTIILTV